VSENSLLSNHVELVLTTADMVGLKDSFLPPLPLPQWALCSSQSGSSYLKSPCKSHRG